jgi:hypothetical protein
MLLAGSSASLYCRKVLPWNDDRVAAEYEYEYEDSSLVCQQVNDLIACVAGGCQVHVLSVI